jgi:hypothetical protein
MNSDAVMVFAVFLFFSIGMIDLAKAIGSSVPARRQLSPSVQRRAVLSSKGSPSEDLARHGFVVFLATLAVTNVPPPPGANRVVHVTVRGDGRRGPRCPRIPQQGGEAFALKLLSPRQSTQLDQRRVKVEQADGRAAAGNRTIAASAKVATRLKTVSARKRRHWPDAPIPESGVVTGTKILRVTHTVNHGMVCHCLPGENVRFQQPQHCSRPSFPQTLTRKQCPIERPENA